MPAFLKSFFHAFFHDKGAAGVAVFLVLSGFLLSAPYWRAFENPPPETRLPSSRAFLKRRLVRLWPAYAVCATVTAALTSPIDGFAWGKWIASLTWANVFMPGLFLAWGDNAPLWSVPVEAVLYAVLPLWAPCLGCRRRKPWTGLAFMALAAIGLHALFRTGARLWLSSAAATLPDDPLAAMSRDWFLSHGVTAMLPLFLLGIAAQGLYRHLGRFGTTAHAKGPAQGPRPGFEAAGGVAAGIALWALFPHALRLVLPTDAVNGWVPRLFASSYPYAFPWFGLALALWLAVGPRTWFFRRVLEWRPLGHFATLSYGFYLWHHLVLSLLLRTSLPGWAWVGATFAISYALAWLSWHGLEKPLLRRLG